MALDPGPGRRRHPPSDLEKPLMAFNESPRERETSRSSRISSVQRKSSAAGPGFARFTACIPDLPLPPDMRPGFLLSSPIRS